MLAVRTTASAVLAALSLLLVGRVATAAELARGVVYAVTELAWRGPKVGPADLPTMTIELSVRFQHESGAPSFTVAGFWDGEDVWRVRFAPTKPGKWTLVEVKSTRPMSGPTAGDSISAADSAKPGFWAPGSSSGRRWYQRSDGSHPYIVGNTHYDFLFAPLGTEATAASIRKDIADNAAYFKKLRFCLMSPRFENRSALKPFFEGGTPTDKETDQPNPAFFRERVDAAVAEAFDRDLIADLIMAGSVGDQAASNLGFLKYVAARYGAYPNVWLTIGQEWNESVSAAYEVEIGTKLRALLPYPTPLSTHPVNAWNPELNGPWHDHSIRQRKSEEMSNAAGDTRKDYAANGGKPTVNDENGYDPGEASTEDVLEGITGTFLGGGYGTTGHKTASKQGGYFWGHAARGKSIDEHPSAAPLGVMRRWIDRNVRFWNMTPVAQASASIFAGAPYAWPALVWDGEQYLMGSDAAGTVQIKLPAGQWRIERLDVVSRKEEVVAVSATGTVAYIAPNSRATLTLVTKIGGAADRAPDVTPVEPKPGGVDPLPEGMQPAPGGDQMPRVTTVSSDLDAAVVGRPYAEDIEVDGGDAPLRWTATDLPPGLSLDAGGALEGTPTKAGTFSFSVKVTDADGDSAEASLTLEVTEAGGAGGAGVGGAGGSAGRGGADASRGGAGSAGGATSDGDADPPSTKASGCAVGGEDSSPLWIVWLVALLLYGRRRARVSSR